MAGSTVPQPTFGPNGFVAPDEATEVLPAVKNDVNSALGGGFNMSDETPQGQLSVSMAACLGNVNDLFVKYTQQVDPSYADGRMQDAIARIYFLERLPAQATVVQATCLGLVGVVIPAGSLARDVAGNLYGCDNNVTIPESGSVLATFTCTVAGPTACPAGTLTTIYQTILGWDSITNAADGVVGRSTEKRAAFERRRSLSVEQNASGALPAILGTVLSVDGVLDAYVAENVNNTPLEIKGFTLAPNSLYVAVVGGTAADVAKAIWTRKAPGCGYNGNTVVTVIDDSPDYNPPYPSYQIRFETPEPVTVIASVAIANNALVPSNAVTLIQTALATAFAGEDGGPRARIGDTIFASRFYAPVALLGSWAQIVTIKLGCSNQPSSVFTGSISGTTMSIDSVTSGIIAVGQSVTGNNVLPGTTIIDGSGVSWTLSQSQTVTLGEMKGVVATSDEVSIDIDQTPVMVAGDTSVVLL